MQVFLQILAFLIANRDQIIDIIKAIEAMIPDAPGTEKAAVLKNAVGEVLGTARLLDTAWPMVQPVLNLLVASVKAPK